MTFLELIRLIVWILSWLGGTAVDVPTVPTPPPATTTTATVAEDDAAWNCQTMGNGICGPTATGPATLDGQPIVTAADVGRCAERLGGMTDSNLARCADLADFPCGDSYVDPYREDC